MQRTKQKFQKRVIIRRAKEYRRSGNISAAVELLENALTQWPADRDLNLALSGMHQSNCDWNAFFKMYENAESVLYPGNLVIKWRYGIALMGSLRFDEAITKFQYVINNWDSHNESPQILGNAHACLGICYAILGEWSKIEAGWSLPAAGPGISLRANQIYQNGPHTLLPVVFRSPDS